MMSKKILQIAMLAIPTMLPNLIHSLVVISCPYLFDNIVVITPADEPMGVIFPPMPTPIASAHHNMLE